MKLLVITQKVDYTDKNLGFFHEWLKRLALQVEKVTVICLYQGEHNLPSNVTVLSLGKEKKASRYRYLLSFYQYIISLRAEYDGVLVHMNPEYCILGGLLWRLWKKPLLLWYMHRSVDIKLRVAEKFVDRIFTASAESFRLPSKKVEVTGHGIDCEAFNQANIGAADYSVLKIFTVGRISRSKDLETLIEGFGLFLEQSPGTRAIFSIVGEAITPADQKYLQELLVLVERLRLKNTVCFMGGVEHVQLPDFYRNQHIFLHAGQNGSLDKAGLEALASGLMVISSSEAYAPLAARGIATAFESKNPVALAQKIFSETRKISPNSAGRNYVVLNHSLAGLIKKIVGFFSKPASAQSGSKKWLAIFSVAFLLRIFLLGATFFASNQQHQTFLNTVKMDGYYEIAVNMINEGAFSRDTAPPLRPDSIRTPGYPAFVAAFLAVFHSIEVLLLVQIVIGSLIPLLGKKIAGLVGLSERMTGVVAWLLVFEPLGVLLSTKILTETLFTFFLLAAIAGLAASLRRVQENEPPSKLLGLAAGIGVLFGMSTLIRPTVLYLPWGLSLIWLAVRALRRRTLYIQPLLIFLLISNLIITPWVLRNRTVFGTFGYSSIQEQVLFSYFVPSIFSVERHESFGVSQAAWFKEHNLVEYPEIFISNAPRFQAAALAVVKSHLPGAAQVAMLSVATFFTHDGLLDLWASVGMGDKVLAAYHQGLHFPWVLPLGMMLMVRIVWAGAFFLALAGVVYRLISRKMNAQWWLLVLVIGYFALTTVSNGLGVNGRFRTPVEALIFIVAIDGAWQLSQLKNPLKIRRRNATIGL